MERLRDRAEHIMASGASPPGFASMAIDGDHNWGGGLVSNPPQHVMDSESREDMLVLQIDLLSARGKLPQKLDEVAEQDKDIRHSSRTGSGTGNARVRQGLRGPLFTFLNRLPEEPRGSGGTASAPKNAKMIDVVHLIYRPAKPATVAAMTRKGGTALPRKGSDQWLGRKTAL
jgi:NTE family protein